MEKQNLKGPTVGYAIKALNIIDMNFYPVSFTSHLEIILVLRRKKSLAFLTVLLPGQYH